jgi:hypothetical protein
MPRLVVTANIVPSSPILVNLMMEALCSSKESVLTRLILHNNPEDGILQLFASNFQIGNRKIRDSERMTAGILQIQIFLNNYFYHCFKIFRIDMEGS